jgi:hypothetical protein
MPLCSAGCRLGVVPDQQCPTCLCPLDNGGSSSTQRPAPGTLGSIFSDDDLALDWLLGDKAAAETLLPYLGKEWNGVFFFYIYFENTRLGFESFDILSFFYFVRSVRP